MQTSAIAPRRPSQGRFAINLRSGGRAGGVRFQRVSCCLNSQTDLHVRGTSRGAQRPALCPNQICPHLILRRLHKTFDFKKTFWL